MLRQSPIFRGARQQNLSCLQFLYRGYPADDYVWPFIIVSPEPSRGLILHLLDAVKVMSPKPFRSNRSVVAFDIGVLLRLSQLNVNNPIPAFSAQV